MNRFLLLALTAGLSLPVQAEIDPKVREACLPAADFLGCVKAYTTKPTDIPSLRVIQGKTELTGNSCPNGYAYNGAGYCREVICGDKWRHHEDLRGKGWKCEMPFFKTMWGQRSLKAVVDESCPDEEPIIGTLSSCWTNEMIEKNLTKKKKPVKTDVYSGSVKINCNSPVWRDRPRCN